MSVVQSESRGYWIAPLVSVDRLHMPSALDSRRQSPVPRRQLVKPIFGASRSGGPTPGRTGPVHLVEEQATRHGEIQGVGCADHRDADKVRAQVAQERGKPLALLAEDE